MDPNNKFTQRVSLSSETFRLQYLGYILFCSVILPIVAVTAPLPSSPFLSYKLLMHFVRGFMTRGQHPLNLPWNDFFHIIIQHPFLCPFRYLSPFSYIPSPSKLTILTVGFLYQLCYFISVFSLRSAPIWISPFDRNKTSIHTQNWILYSANDWHMVSEIWRLSTLANYSILSTRKMLFIICHCTHSHRWLLLRYL